MDSKLLYGVTKPARYTGGEWNSIVKDWEEIPVRVALAYPDLYEIGMSNMAVHILYDILNRQPDVLAERVFAPWPDMGNLLQEKEIPLFSLETKHSLKDFDVVGFSLSYELTFTNVLYMLKLSGIPLFSKDRNDTCPIIIAGGGGILNPEPMADFIDYFVLGEAEEVLLDLVDSWRIWKKEGLSREEILKYSAKIPGVYVPRFYDVAYNPDGTVKSIKPNTPEASERVVRRVVAELPPPVTRPVVPYIETVHDRGAVEIQRGCSRGCRFCQASTLYRPMRGRSHEEVIKAVDELLSNCGYNEISLISLSSSDYPGIQELVDRLVYRYRNDHLTISLPSLHVDESSVRLVETLSAHRKTGITFAPEAGSARLQRSINKTISDETLIRTVSAVFSKGWSNVKLYFMIGLPGETDEDVKEIARLIELVAAVGKAEGKNPHIRVSLSTLVPKPHTPFQWVGQETEDILVRKHELLRQVMPHRGVSLSWSDPHVSLLEAVISRGDRRLGEVIYQAFLAGSIFDAWGEHFKFENWQKAFQQTGLDPAFYANRTRSLDEIMPWDHIDIGVTTGYLKNEYMKSLKGIETGNCLYDDCNRCGLQRWVIRCQEKAARVKKVSLP